MNLNAEISRDSFINFYEDNRDYIVPILAISVSILLFFTLILPQITSFPEKKGKFDQEVDRVTKLKEYQQTLKSADPDIIDSEVLTASQVLPPQKDFESVLNAISSAANNTSTIIDGYTFSSDVGILGKDIRRFPQLQFNVEIEGGVPQAVLFINELYKTMPISDVSQIVAKETTKISLVFYYKAFSPAGFEARTDIAPLSAEESELLETVSQWNKPVETTFLIPEVEATPSAETETP